MSVRFHRFNARRLAEWLVCPVLIGIANAAIAQAPSTPAGSQPQLRVPLGKPSDPQLKAPQGDAPSTQAQPGAAAPMPATPASNAQAQNGRALDTIVAVVNDEIVTRNELDNRIAQIERQLRGQNVQLPSQDVLERQVLERMILERAQVQLARDDGIRVDDLTLDRTIARIAEGNKMPMQQFRDRVEEQGTPWSRFREDIRNEILMARVREREVEQRVQVTDSEVDEFLRRQKDGGNVQANIAQILIRVPENATPEQVALRRQRADAVVNELRGGADFARVAVATSDGFDASRGGEMGWRSLDRYPQLFVDAVEKLQPGGVSDVIRCAAGFHVLKLVGRRDDAPQNQQVQQTHARHVLLRVGEQGLTDSEAQRRLAEYKQRIENKSMDFAEVAKRYSRDSTAGSGGDLGWVLPGDTVPEFESAMNNLQPGQISDPVQTPFGWHLIQVVERKTDALPNDRLRFAARQALRDRKAEEQFQEWLRQLRDRAYVEVRLDTARVN